MQPLKPLVKAAKVSVDKDSTVIVEGSGNPEAIANRVAVKSQIETTTSEFDREKKITRTFGQIVWWCCRIKVGAATETELKEMKLRIEDALMRPFAQPLKKGSLPRWFLSMFISAVAAPN